MNITLKNRDKRIAILLITAFAWLFIGSLVIFHEEQVLGKHFNLNIQAFISPKSNDKQGLDLQHHNPVLKLPVSGGSACLLTQNILSAIYSSSFEIKPKETSSFYPDKDFLNYIPLRAPPSL